MAPSTPSSRSWQRLVHGKVEPAIVKSHSPAVTQRAFPHALLIERYTPTEHIARLAEFLEGLRESLGASLRDLITEHHGLKLGLGVDVHYRHMFEERIALWHRITHTAVLHNDFQIDQVLA